MNTSTIVQKLWNYCNVLRDDGMSYGDYPGSSPGQANNEQLTNPLFLKMADERTKAPYNQKSPVPDKYSWPSLIKKDGDELFTHYLHTLEALGLLARRAQASNQKGLLGLIFNKSQNKFDSHRPRAVLTLLARCGRPIFDGDCQDPAKRRLVVDFMDDDRGIETLKNFSLA